MARQQPRWIAQFSRASVGTLQRERGVRTSRDQRANALSAFLLPDDEKREHRGYETDAFGWRAAPMFLEVDINLGLGR
jgi:hypothetical protein